MNNVVGNYTGKIFRYSTNVLSNPKIITSLITYHINRFRDDVRAKNGYFTYPHNIIFLAGLPMSGTTWMKNLLARIPGYYSRKTPMPWDVEYNQNICDSAFIYTPKDAYTLFKTHLNPTSDNLDCLNRNGVTRILITYRDFRDVALSRVHRLMEFPKPVNAYDYVDYQEIGFDMALEHSLRHIADEYLPWIAGWKKFASLEPERYYFTKYEELKSNTMDEYKKVLNFYEIILPEKLLAENIEKSKGKGNVKDNMFNAKVLPFGISSNFRSGKVGGWKNEFSERHVNLAKDILGEALIDYGYEKDFDWQINNH